MSYHRFYESGDGAMRHDESGCVVYLLRGATASGGEGGLSITDDPKHEQRLDLSSAETFFEF